jgi:hypothetical protein
VNPWRRILEKTALPTVSGRVEAPTTATDRGAKRGRKGKR